MSPAADTKGPADIKAESVPQHRSAALIEADLKSALQPTSHYPVAAQLDAKFREQMTQEVGPAMQKVLDLLQELDKADPAAAANLRTLKCDALVRLAYGNVDALQTLKSLSTSNMSTDAVLGKSGLMMYHWWNSPDSATQKPIIAEFELIAKENPKDNLLLHAGLDGRYHPVERRHWPGSPC